jgi:hypothetical protein
MLMVSPRSADRAPLVDGFHPLWMAFTSFECSLTGPPPGSHACHVCSAQRSLATSTLSLLYLIISGPMDTGSDASITSALTSSGLCTLWPMGWQRPCPALGVVVSNVLPGPPDPVPRMDRTLPMTEFLFYSITCLVRLVPGVVLYKVIYRLGLEKPWSFQARFP